MRLPRSIHGRMLALSALTTAVALPVAGVAIGGVLDHFVTRNVDARLDDRLRMLRACVRADGTIDRALLARVTADRAIGDTAWVIETPMGAVGDPVLRRIEEPGPPGPPGPRAEARPFEVRPPDDGLRLHGRSDRIATDGGPVRIAVALPRRAIDAPLRSALLPLLAMLAMLALLLAAATLVQLRLGLGPLRRLRAGVADIRQGRARSVAEDQPDELRPLAVELNALVHDNEAALASARASAANLAHALKTPVATLALDLHGDPRGRQVERIDATIRHHLSRARRNAVDRRAATPLGPAIAALAAAVRGLHRGSGVGIEVAVPEVSVAIDAADLDELAGNLIDNAARHARSVVRIDATRDGAMVVLRVTDDGPGIPAADRARATDPGVRLDERGDGHGFGLAIVRDLAGLYGGRLVLDDAAGGGLAASVALPRAG